MINRCKRFAHRIIEFIYSAASNYKQHLQVFTLTMSTASGSNEDKKGMTLCSGYWRLESNDMNIIQAIIVIIFKFHGVLCEILRFDANYISPKSVLSDDGKTVECTGTGKNNGWVLAGGDTVKQGITVWRIKVNLHCTNNEKSVIQKGSSYNNRYTIQTEDGLD